MTMELSTRDDAVARAERIRAGIRSLVELKRDIADAYHARDWEKLGYGSWDAYTAGEFDGVMPRLDRVERRELVVSLREEGLSTRVIAAATGVDQKTVVNDVRATAEEFSSPDEPTATSGAPTVRGADGKMYQPKRPPISREELEELKPHKPEQAKPRRRPITDQSEDAGWEIRKSAERVARILADDRYMKNEEQVKLTLRGHLLFAQETIAKALNKLGD